VSLQENLNENHVKTDSILIVDDSPENLIVLGNLLSPYYRVHVANSGLHAFELLKKLDTLPDLILLDIMMPEVDGFSVLTELQSNEATSDIPVIFLTALDSIADEQKGLRLGAIDYITKPIRPEIVLARIRNHLELKHARDRLSHQRDGLEQAVADRMQENEVLQNVVIRALARLAEVRDNATGHHILRTQLYVDALARQLAKNPLYESVLDEKTIRLLMKSAPLHDIGKVGIPDNILLKPGSLTEEEWKIMRTHARLGAEALEQAITDVEQPVPFLDFAREIAHYHHERWDGGGYPEGLKGTEIPLSARLMSVADTFDALVNPREYRAASSLDKARDVILAESGKQFDPDVVEAFDSCFDEFMNIAFRYREVSLA
jgi:putative two-component system response regulator